MSIIANQNQIKLNSQWDFQNANTNYSWKLTVVDSFKPSTTNENTWDSLNYHRNRLNSYYNTTQHRFHWCWWQNTEWKIKIEPIHVSMSINSLLPQNLHFSSSKIYVHIDGVSINNFFLFSPKSN